jgi:acetylornithine deacetylase
MLFPREETVRMFCEITAIDSSNAFLSNGPGERDILAYFAEALGEIGIESHIENINETNANLVAVIKGSGGGKNLTLYAHADTVGYALWRETALKARVEGDSIYGLGVADDKGHCAAMLQFAEALVRGGRSVAGDITLLFCADEEGASAGAFDYVKHHAPEALLALESAPLQNINISHQGFGWLKLRVEGAAGHGSAGCGNTDAIARMAEVVTRLSRHAEKTFNKKPHPLNGITVYHTSTIAGGTDFAAYPDSCELGIEIGIQPGESVDDRVGEINAIFDEVRKIYPDLDASVDVIIARQPFETKGTDELFGHLALSVEKVCGQRAKRVGENSWGDAQIFQDAGFPTLGIGANGGNLHAPGEWLDLVQFEQLVEVLVDAAERYCA